MVSLLGLGLLKVFSSLSSERLEPVFAPPPPPEMIGNYLHSGNKGVGGSKGGERASLRSFTTSALSFEVLSKPFPKSLGVASLKIYSSLAKS